MLYFYVSLKRCPLRSPAIAGVANLMNSLANELYKSKRLLLKVNNYGRKTLSGI